MRRAACATALAAVVASAWMLGAPADAANTGTGLLRAKDVGFPQTGSAHSAELIRASQQSPASCDDPDTREYEGQRIAFASNAAGPSGPSLNEYVLDLGSSGEAASTFSAFQDDNEAAVDCARAKSRSGVSVTSGPNGVGDQRYTFVNPITIGGKSVPVTEIGVHDGAHVIVLVFVGWPNDRPTPTAIAKKAVKRLG